MGCPFRGYTDPILGGGVDRTAVRGGDHGRVRRRELLPVQSGHTGRDGGVPDADVRFAVIMGRFTCVVPRRRPA
jgi:hypothetical protein